MPTIHNPGAFIKLRGAHTETVDDEFSGSLPDFLFYYALNHNEPYITSQNQNHPLLSKGQWDAVVDSNFSAAFSDTHLTIKDAIDGITPNAGDLDTIVSIFVRKAGDTAAITIASGDNVQRIVGKDADTTTVPVDMTCEKEDVTFEAFKSSNSLTIKAKGNTVRDCLLTGSGLINASNGSLSVGDLQILDNRFRGHSGLIALRLGVAGRSLVRGNRFTTAAGATNDVDTAHGSTDLRGLVLTSNRFGGTAPLSYRFESDNSSGLITDGVISHNHLETLTNGGMWLQCHRTLISNNTFWSLLSPIASGKRALFVRTTTVAGATEVTVLANSFKGNSSSDVLFECGSTDATAKGLVLVGNQFVTGTILGSQDAAWIGNNMAGCTIDFQSKTGIVVIGGDMTSATLQNVPAHIEFRGVKGVADRDYGASMVQATAPDTPDTGQIWLDTSTSGTGTASLAIVTKTAGYTVTDSDAVILCDASGGAFTITLPTAVGRAGKIFTIKKIDASANAVTVDGDGAETIDGSTTQVIATQYNSITIISDGSEWHIT